MRLSQEGVVAELVVDLLTRGRGKRVLRGKQRIRLETV